VTPVLHSGDSSQGYGLRALVEDLQLQGISEAQLLRAAGLRTLVGALSSTQRIAVLRAAQELTNDPLTALRAGTRQQVGHFGVYGFALATSATFGDAFNFGRHNLDLAGSVLRISYRLEQGVGIMHSHNPQALGALLPFVAEFWRSSMITLLSEVLGRRFPTRAMYFPFKKPAHGGAYGDYFDCPVYFAQDLMEWHFDASVLAAPCPNASSLTSRICQEFCEDIASRSLAGSSLQQELRTLILGSIGRKLTADDAASVIGKSKRTLFRQLAQEGTSFQSLLDETRASIACEYLKNTKLSVSEIADRCGFGDEANFRKAFYRWRRQTPSEWRRQDGVDRR
jgi:AraC-like DNA-binding protein